MFHGVGGSSHTQTRKPHRTNAVASSHPCMKGLGHCAEIGNQAAGERACDRKPHLACMLIIPIEIATGCSGTNNTDARRYLTTLNAANGKFFGPVARYDDGATQSYHGMLLSVQKRLSKGTSLSANYTLSHCIGNFADINANGPPADETYINPNNRNFDRGNCDIDRRHLFNLTASGQTPKFNNKTVNMLASGWRLSGIYRYNAGAPINVNYNTTDRALNGTLRQRPNLVAGANPYGDTSGGPNTAYLNQIGRAHV